MNKKMVRFLSMLLGAVMLLGTCTISAAAEQTQLPLVDEPTTLTIWAATGTIDPQVGISGYGDVLVWQELEKRTGVHIEWIHPPLGQEREVFNLMIASGELPDIIFDGAGYYTPGLDHGVDSGLFLRLNELIDEYAPNYKELRQRSDEIIKDSITDAGNIVAMHSINTPNQGPWYGPVIRKDWLDKLGLDIPETYDDWYVALKAFKEELGAEAPMWLNFRGSGWYSAFSAGYGVTGLANNAKDSFFQVDGVVKYSPLEEGYRDYITMLAKWYAEGLIDADFFTRRDYAVPDVLLNNGNTGLFSDMYITLAYRAYLSGDPTMDVVAIPMPVRERGEVAHIRRYSFDVGAFKTIITTSCKNPELAVKWLDYMCSDEGSLLMSYGIEGVTYNMVDGVPVPSDLIIHNPDGLTPDNARMKYTTISYPGKYYWQRELTGVAQKSLDAINQIWPDSADGAYMIPSAVSMTDKEGAIFSRIMGDVDTYALEMTIKFIIGAEPLENYDTFISNLKAMGVDEVIKVLQDTLDRYYVR